MGAFAEAGVSIVRADAGENLTDADNVLAESFSARFSRPSRANRRVSPLASRAASALGIAYIGLEWPT